MNTDSSTNTNSKQWIDRYIAAYFDVTKHLFADIREAIQEELTPEQFQILLFISESRRCNSTELADAFLVGKSSITAIITRLADRGLIDRTRDESDRRQVYLSLTSRGVSVLKEAEQKVQDMVSSYLVHFEEQEVEAFISTFEKLAYLIRREE